jgi:uncharacterized membrane protein YjjB (DUF3815 family)
MIIEVFMAFFGVVAFAVLLGVPKSEWIFAGTTGGIGRAAFIVFKALLASSVYGTFIAAVFITFFARLFAVKRRIPGIIYLRSGVFPLVPGSSIYYTAYHIFYNERDLAAATGTAALTHALALAFGIMISFQIPQKFFNNVLGRR